MATVHLAGAASHLVLQLPPLPCHLSPLACRAAQTLGLVVLSLWLRPQPSPSSGRALAVLTAFALWAIVLAALNVGMAVCVAGQLVPSVLLVGSSFAVAAPEWPLWQSLRRVLVASLPPLLAAVWVQQLAAVRDDDPLAAVLALAPARGSWLGPVLSMAALPSYALLVGLVW